MTHPDGVPCAVLDAACAAAARVSYPSLSLRLDRAESFNQDGTYVLRGDAATDAAVARLRRPLVAALRRFGLKPGESKTPHMSLVYRCGHKVLEHSIEPLVWTAQRFVLVLSHVGLTRHEWLAAWDLPQR
ncbi:2'-5' RNA ligase family protein [Roseateles sp. LYH14W]|uniref:2'-5' RNA ligase family protein n=1 Tax=Pelomonas parva TaxID=3299032 RepID=A0ABW7FBF2_9BURK